MTAGVAPIEHTRQLLTLDGPFDFESGERLPNIDIAYETWGTLDADGGNAVYVCHALTGDAHAGTVETDGDDPPGWWDGVIGPGRALDTDRYYIVCANLLGSCYGTSGPASRDPRNGEIYGMDFPQVTTRDMIRVQKQLLETLGIHHLHLIIGGSLGGMQVWQWLVDEPRFVRAGIPIAGTTQGSPWMIALNQVARQAIFNDPAWQLGRYNGRGPDSGLSLARMIAMISYRSDRQFWERFGRDMSAAGTGDARQLDGSFQVENYLDHHGRKLVDRFDARSYVYLTRAMDLHDVARGYDDLEQALERIEAKVLTIGIDSDVLYYPHELQTAATKLEDLGKDVTYKEIQTPYGHDAFLVEYDQLNRLVRDFLEVLR